MALVVMLLPRVIAPTSEAVRHQTVANVQVLAILLRAAARVELGANLLLILRRAMKLRVLVLLFL